MSGRLNKRVVLVTGASSGIGAEVAKRCTAEGASVIISDTQVEAGQRLAGELDRATFIKLDVAQETDWAGVSKLVEHRYGGLDVLVNNAGIGLYTPLKTVSLDRWRKVMAVNLDGVLLGIQCACPLMERRGGGSIINVASVLAKVGQANYAAYCASKGGVTALTKAAALEFAPSNIRVNSVHPGFIATPMTMGPIGKLDNGAEIEKGLVNAQPLGRLGRPEEIADGVLFLASDESRFMTGSELVIDGGFLAR